MEQAELITRMKTSVQKLGSSTLNYGDTTLTRFLIARSMDPDKAAKMFVQWQKWRADFVPLGNIPDSEVCDELGARKICLGGPTKDGHPLVIVKACNHFLPKDQLQFKKFVVHFLDKAIASAHKGTEIGNERMVVIFDLQQITYKNVDARGLITGFQFLQAYYPERLERFYILHMPRFFVGVWRIVSRFLEKATLQKIVIVTNEEETRRCIEEVGEEALPECYGGKAELVALQDVVLSTTAQNLWCIFLTRQLQGILLIESQGPPYFRVPDEHFMAPLEMVWRQNLVVRFYFNNGVPMCFPWVNANAHKGTEIGNERMVVIFDLQQSTYKNVDARGLITGFQFLQAYYPERLERFYILHMPRFFVGVWRIVSRFLEKATLQKIVILTNEEETRRCIEEVGEETLPDCYGGKAELVALQDVVLSTTAQV